LQGRTDLPNADFASPRLLNLWVDADTPVQDVDRAVAVIRAELAGPRAEESGSPAQRRSSSASVS
jgi:hypothetical protein